jgi:hypothetical protein
MRIGFVDERIGIADGCVRLVFVILEMMEEL